MLNNSQVFKSHPSKIFTLLDSQLSIEDSPWLTWEPETLLRQFPEVTDTAMQDKLLAVQAAASNLGMPLSVSTAFEKTMHAFNNNVCVMDVPQPVFIEEILYGVTQLKELARLIHDGVPEFIGEIPGYVASCGYYYNWIFLPTPLAFAHEMLNYMNGLQPASAKYKLYAEHMQSIEKAARQLGEAQLLEGDLSALDSLPEDTALSIFIRKVVGAYVFDPTQGELGV